MQLGDHDNDDSLSGFLCVFGEYGDGYVGEL